MTVKVIVHNTDTGATGEDEVPADFRYVVVMGEEWELKSEKMNRSGDRIVLTLGKV